MREYTTEYLQETKAACLGSLDEIAREGARRMLAQALQAEVDEYLQKAKDIRDEQGHALVVRNGRARERTVTLGVGDLKVRAPRVDDRRQGERFSSRILPPYMRRSPRIDEALPVLYLKGLSTGDFGEALTALLGAEGAGFSASTITRLLQVWQDESTRLASIGPGANARWMVRTMFTSGPMACTSKCAWRKTAWLA